MTKAEAISLAKQQAKKRQERIYVVLSKHYVNCYGAAEEGYNVATLYDLDRWYQGVPIEYHAEGGRDG